MIFKETSTPLLSQDLDEVEHRLHFTFPKEFREHYLNFNGGYPAKDRFVDNELTCIVQDFLPIRYPTPPLSTFERSFFRVKVEQRILPDYLIPFAVDPGGDYYCFSTRGNEPGAIYAFHMDRFKEPDRAMERLAASLTEFLSKLKSKDELEQSSPRG